MLFKLRRFDWCKLIVSSDEPLIIYGIFSITRRQASIHTYIYIHVCLHTCIHAIIHTYLPCLAIPITPYILIYTYVYTCTYVRMWYGMEGWGRDWIMEGWDGRGDDRCGREVMEGGIWREGWGRRDGEGGGQILHG